jgi:dethiobiotin synthetase/adenosylmethionine--8-amino-7-oxononanoate aminotransferase
VFVGLYRLGMPSTAALLGVAPDIACYAKLLTGGTVPLAVTLASEAVFAAFSGATKPQALLHGHSYSAHAIGCAAACAALDAYADPTRNPNILPASGTLRELWPAALVRELSTLPSVERVVCLGTVFAAAIRTSSGGYASEATATLVRRLVARGVRARPLGNVLYLVRARARALRVHAYVHTSARARARAAPRVAAITRATSAVRRDLPLECPRAS